MPTPRHSPLSDVAKGCTHYLHGDGPRTAAALLASLSDDVSMDIYGQGGVVAELEAKVASLLGKPAALFMPSGVMAQQTSLRVLADRTRSRNVAMHPKCHLIQHEEGAAERLHDLHAVVVGSDHEPLTRASLETVKDHLAALLIELPQRDLGGTLPTWAELVSQVEWARERSVAVHLDGARLWEAAPYYEKSAGKSVADVAGLFDTVYVSFYKGLGALAGCCVAGERDVIDELFQWRIRHGGRMFMMWPYAASALDGLRTRRTEMAARWRRAQAVARQMRTVEGVTVLPEQVRTPLMHLQLAVSLKDFERNVRQIAREHSVWTYGRPFDSLGPRLQVLEFQVGRATMELSVNETVTIIGELASAH